MALTRAITLWENTPTPRTQITNNRAYQNGPGLRGSDVRFYTDTEKRAMARQITRFTLTDILGYPNVSDAIPNINRDIAKQLMLDRLYHGLFDWPDDCGPLDWDYKVAYVMGIKFDPSPQVIRYYEGVLSGTQRKFPDHFFDGPLGEEKLAILLAEAIRRFMPLPVDFQDKTYDDKLAYYYCSFSSPYLINERLKEAKIYEICYSYYKSPVDYFHYSLMPEDRVEWMYGNGTMLWDTAEERNK